jgi:hypothetical protein
MRRSDSRYPMMTKYLPQIVPSIRDSHAPNITAATRAIPALTQALSIQEISQAVTIMGASVRKAIQKITALPRKPRILPSHHAAADSSGLSVNPSSFSNSFCICPPALKTASNLAIAKGSNRKSLNIYCKQKAGLAHYSFYAIFAAPKYPPRWLIWSSFAAANRGRSQLH